MVVHSKQILASKWIANEIPNGIIDGINKFFILNNIPLNDVIVRLNGLTIVPGIDKDYIISSDTIEFIKPPKIGNEVVVSYFSS